MKNFGSNKKDGPTRVLGSRRPTIQDFDTTGYSQVTFVTLPFLNLSCNLDLCEVGTEVADHHPEREL
jgi:hypothetical protein